ncbi:HAD family hydrolase [Mycoplasma sp. Ms02]|uniref:HAD family hydrolase n=1 Tax=Mycoplasma sp. Ms02 TaxID=353851 RepID=UPI001C8B04D5|nr:HAD family hydrolase [Mycoplasma sp. Ms02]QZE12366.1 HAD family hydrolase [Mycoplasma sp. Ms02]
MNKFVIFSDVDGTIYGFPHKKLSEVNRLKINSLSEKGIPFVINTGNALVDKIKRLGDILGSRYLICSGGAVIYDNYDKKYLHIEKMDLNEVQRLFDVAEQINARLYYFGKDQNYFKNHSQEMYDFLSEFMEYHDWITDGRIPEDIHKIEVYGDYEEVKRVWQEFQKHDFDLNIIYLGSHIEITKKGVSKGSAIKWMCENIFQTDPENVMGIGDSENDIAMFEVAGYSYAMDNTPAHVKKYVKYFTSDVAQNGISEAIDDYLYRISLEIKRQEIEQKLQKAK